MSCPSFPEICVRVLEFLKFFSLPLSLFSFFDFLKFPCSPLTFRNYPLCPQISEILRSALAFFECPSVLLQFNSYSGLSLLADCGGGGNNDCDGGNDGGGNGGNGGGDDCLDHSHLRTYQSHCQNDQRCKLWHCSSSVSCG